MNFYGQDQHVEERDDLEDDADENVSRVTYIKAPKNEPIDLDMDDFKPPKEQYIPPQDPEEDSKLDLEIINSCMERHSTFHTVMQRRMANIKVV